MSSLRFLLLVPLACALVFACGSDDTNDTKGALGGGPPAAPIAEGDFYARFVDAMCTDMAACCTADGQRFVQGTCASTLNAAGADAGVQGDSFLARLLGAKGLTYDAQAAGDCLEGIKAQQKRCAGPAVNEKDVFLSAFASPKLFACYGVFKGGTKKPGDACTEQYECEIPAGAFGACTPSPEDRTKSRCTVASAAKPGEACTPLDDGSVDAHVCEFDGIFSGTTDLTKLTHCDRATMKCVAYTFVDDGAACAGDGPFCRPPSRCSSSKGGTCFAPSAVGGDCGQPGQVCQDGLACGADGKCTPGGAVGASCKNGDDCATGKCSPTNTCISAYAGFSSSTLCAPRE